MSSMHRPSPPWWTVSAVPHASPSSSTVHGLHSWRDPTPYVQYGLSPRCHTQYMTTYMLGRRMIQNQNGEVLMPQVCSLLRSEQKLDLAVACTKAT